MQFKDYFSGHAQDYASYRPDYPNNLFEYLSSLVPEHALAWDCATGNGQAAVKLANYFSQVIATDLSEEQIKSAVQKNNITYSVAPAENTNLADQSIDLITVATALHWFDFDKFYQEVKRVLKSNGVLAAWCYSSPAITPEVEAIKAEFYKELILPSKEEAVKRLVEDEYRTIPFLFPKLETPKFHIEKSWDFSQFICYINTWSSVKIITKEKGVNPLEKFIPQLLKVWGNPESIKLIRWPIHLLAAKIAS